MTSMLNVLKLRLKKLQKKLAKARKNRKGNLGMTLIEIMVVVIIMTMIAGGVGFGVFTYWRRSQVNAAKQGVLVVQQAAEMFMQSNPDHSCPTTAELKQAGDLRGNGSENDPWGRPYSISCEGGHVTVVSSGPDRQAGNGDDLSSGGNTAPAQ